MRELFYLSVSLLIGCLGNVWLERRIRKSDDDSREKRLLAEAEARLARCVEAYEALEASSKATEASAEKLRMRHQKLLIFLRSVLSNWDKLTVSEQEEALSELAVYRESMKYLN